VEHEVSHDSGGDGTPGVLNVLAFIGLGKAPLMVVLLILFGSIGLLGWILNSVLSRTFGTYPNMAFVAVLPITIVAGTLISSRSARFIGRALPPISTTATRAQALVGRRGTVISPYVDQKYGMVHLRDEGGTLINIFAVSKDGEPIKRGSEVALVTYDPVNKVYTVAEV
jgi:membrane protein implicated in regulation of membrane protease activity